MTTVCWDVKNNFWGLKFILFALFQGYTSAFKDLLSWAPKEKWPGAFFWGPPNLIIFCKGGMRNRLKRTL